MLGVEFRGGTDCARPSHEFMPEEIAPALHLDGVVAALDDDDMFHTGRFLAGFVDRRFQRKRLALAKAAVGCHDELRTCIIDAVVECLGRKAAKDDAVGCADARTGQHGDGQLRNHRHIERHAVALFHAEVLHHVRKAADLAVEFCVGKDARIAGLALPDDGGFVATPGVFTLEVSVEAVVTDVQLASDEPLREGHFPGREPSSTVRTTRRSLSPCAPKSASGPFRRACGTRPRSSCSNSLGGRRRGPA